MPGMSYGASKSCAILAACSIPRVDVDFGLCLPADTAALPSPAREPFYYRPEEEIAYGPAAWLWDYLRRRCGSQQRAHPQPVNSRFGAALAAALLLQS